MTTASHSYPLTEGSLRTSLRQTPKTPVFRRAIMTRLWAESDAHAHVSESDESYFIHIYQQLCHFACYGDSGTQLGAFSHEEIVDIALKLKSTVTTANPIPGAPGTGSLIIERSHRLAAGLLLPLNFQGIGGKQPGRSVLWNVETSLKDFVRSLFPLCRQPETPSQGSTCPACGRSTVCDTCATAGQGQGEQSGSLEVIFSRSFSAQRLARIAGFEIVWTSNLLDHLRMDDANEKVRIYIFHQVKLLSRVQKDLFPEGFIQETRETLALILPRRDKSTRKWFAKLQRAHHLDPEAIKCEAIGSQGLSTQHYKYWGSRLIDLKEAYDGQQPRDPLQVWRDDRQVVQWLTFWIAALVLLLTIVFGLIQTITGILQVTRMK